jgi:curli biogenesis system outer membrane secretion channel CsgG
MATILRAVVLLASGMSVLIGSPALAQISSQPIPTGASSTPQAPRILKRKVVVGRFTNATRYGKALLTDTERDPLAFQASEMLTARLADSGKFILFERSDLEGLDREQEIAGFNRALIGVDALAVGSVTEFGRKVEGKSGFLNSQTRQIATATVEVRLIDVQTGQVFFSAVGKGTASVETKEVAGFGSQAGHDSTLNDKAISAAVSDLTNNLIQRLAERRWSTDILKIQGNQIFISGGPSQGLRIGDQFQVETTGELVTSGQTGLPIRLPGSPIATVEVTGFFGDDPNAEGSVARITQGSISSKSPQSLIVTEIK